jgi:chromosome segregation ATPase
LMDKMYGSYDAQQVIDAAERLDTRTRMKKAAQQHTKLEIKNSGLERNNVRLEDQNEQLHRDVGTLRDELHTLQSKPSDPAIGSLRSTLDTLTAQHATMQPKVSSAKSRANRAQEAVQTLTTQVQTMQTALDNTPAKERVDTIAQRVDTLDNAKEDLLTSMRTMKSTATALEGKVQTLTDKPADPAIATLRSVLDRVTTQQTAMQTSVTDAQRNAASAQELAQSFAQRMGTTRALVNTLERDVDALDARLANIPVQDEYDELERRITAFNDDKFDMMRTVQTMAESAALLDREVHRSILKPPDPAIAQLRRDLNAVMTRQEVIEKSLAGGRRA